MAYEGVVPDRCTHVQNGVVVYNSKGGDERKRPNNSTDSDPRCFAYFCGRMNNRRELGTLRRQFAPLMPTQLGIAETDQKIVSGNVDLFNL